MSLRSALGDARDQILCRFHRRTITLGGAGPFISFSFDDFPRSAYLEGGSILKSRGVHGTYYVAMGLRNTANHLGDLFQMEDLEGVAGDGHEVASHTFSHSSARKIALADFQQDVEKGSCALQQLAALGATTNFAYPYGAATLASKRKSISSISSWRGIIGGINGGQIDGVADAPVDLNLLRANSVYGDIDRLPKAERLIRENEQKKGWLIFYTHDVRNQPSPYGCKPALLDATVALAQKSSARILPVAGVMAQLGLAAETSAERFLDDRKFAGRQKFAGGDKAEAGKY